MRGRGAKGPNARDPADRWGATLRVYDTSGPIGAEVRQVLDALRDPWIYQRGDVVEVERIPTPFRPSRNAFGSAGERCEAVARHSDDACSSRRDYTGDGVRCNSRGHVPGFCVRDEVARGRASYQRISTHPEIEPMIIGRNFTS